MRYIIITLMLMFTTPAFSNMVIILDDVQQKLKETPEMSARCEAKIERYSGLVAKYEAIPADERSARSKLKLRLYTLELMNWKSYCLGDSEDTE